jgi:hypothetical protein
MMNDPMILEASRVLAGNLLDKHKDGEKSIDLAFKRILCREMSSKEKSILTGYYKDQLNRFTQNPDQIKPTLQVGEYPLEEKTIKAETAALMQVIVSMYNLEETITKS